MHAEGTPRHRGRTTWVWDVEFTDDDGRVCALSRVTLAVRPAPSLEAMITVDDVRAFTKDLPRSYEVLVRDRIKFRVGQIVYVAFSRDETIMGFGFPKEERQMLVET